MVSAWSPLTAHPSGQRVPNYCLGLLLPPLLRLPPLDRHRPLLLHLPPSSVPQDSILLTFSNPALEAGWRAYQAEHLRGADVLGCSALLVRHSLGAAVWRGVARQWVVCGCCSP